VIEIKVDLSIVNAKPPLRALADVTLHFEDGLITLRRCTVFHKEGQPPWANLPSFPVEKNGKRVYVLLVELPRDLKKKVLEALLDQYRKVVDARA
jgi:hypothetical protein